MNPRYIAFLSVLLVTGFLTGCATTNDTAWPEPRPLGADTAAYQPPRDVERARGRARTAPASEPRVLVPGDTLALPGALALALKESPHLQSFAWEVRARAAQALQAGLYPNPELEAETEDLPTDAPVAGFSGAEQSVRLRIPLELWGRPWKRRDVAETERDLAGWDYEAARLDVWTRTTKAFVGVLAAQERVRLAGELVRLSEAVYETVSRQAEAGEVSPVERTRARVPLSEARIQLNRARQRLEAARSALAGTWGHVGAPSFEAVAGTFGPAPALPSLDSLRPLTGRNPLVARQKTNIQRVEAQLSLEEADRFPVPSLTAGTHSKSTSSRSLRAQRFGSRDAQTLTAGIALPLPLFDRNQGATRRARYRIERARQERRAARVRVDTTLTRSYHALAAAHDEVKTLRAETLPAAQSAFEAIRQGYRRGKFGFLEVLDAQRTLFEVRRQEVRALGAYYQRRADVERLIATPLDAVE